MKVRDLLELINSDELISLTIGIMTVDGVVKDLFTLLDRDVMRCDVIEINAVDGIIAIYAEGNIHEG